MFCFFVARERRACGAKSSVTSAWIGFFSLFERLAEELWLRLQAPLRLQRGMTPENVRGRRFSGEGRPQHPSTITDRLRVEDSLKPAMA